MIRSTKAPAGHINLKIVCALVLIVIIGFFLRVYRLDKNIPSLYADEAGGHYNSWVLLNSPGGGIVNKVFEGMVSYTWLLGLTPLGARLPSAVYGSLAIVALYFLAKALTDSHAVGLLTAILGIVIPWLFMLSRIGFVYIPLLIIFVSTRGFNILLSCFSFISCFSSYFFCFSSILFYKEIYSLYFC